MQVALVEQHGGTHTDNAADSEKQLQHFDPVKVARIRPGMYGRKADRGHHDQRGASAQQSKADRRGKDADQQKLQDRLAIAEACDRCCRNQGEQDCCFQKAVLQSEFGELTERYGQAEWEQPADWTGTTVRP